jgi:hypothetical protein
MKQTYIEKERVLPVIADVDVLVVGGGPAGIGAAVGAAKAGVSVLIVENMGSFGGMWTNGLVITLAGFNSWLRPYRRSVDGVMGEWIRMAAAKGGVEDNRSWVLSSDPEIMKLTADQLLVKYGVGCLLHTWMADVIVEDNTVKGAIVENVDGRGVIKAKVVVDCTGNGDVVARAKADFKISPELQPMTLPFFLADVTPQGEIGYEDELVIPMGPEPGYLGKEMMPYTTRRRDMAIDNDLLNGAYQNGELPFFGGPWFGGLRVNFPWVNTTRIYGSAVNASELTSAEMDGRRDAHRIVNFYRDNCKGFERCWIMNTSSTIGIRETRRLVGEYTMTRADIVECRKFDDTIAMGVWPIDVHPPKGQNGAHDMYVPLPFQIPYRSLVPAKIDNLLVAGRCISTEREALGTIRVGATCGATGHAAGVAAALSAQLDTAPRNLDYEAIQSELTHQGAIIR